MGLFSKLIGMPEPDRSGHSREYFELVAKTAMKMAAHGELPKAIQHMEVFLMNISNQFGYQHPDIGRGKLAKAALLYIGADLYTASTESQAALEVLQFHPGICAFDIEAAKDFQAVIKSAIAALTGHDDKEDRPLESRPFGRWIKTLEM